MYEINTSDLTSVSAGVLSITQMLSSTIPKDNVQIDPKWRDRLLNSQLIFPVGSPPPADFFNLIK